MSRVESSRNEAESPLNPIQCLIDTVFLCGSQSDTHTQMDSAPLLTETRLSAQMTRRGGRDAAGRGAGAAEAPETA